MAQNNATREPVVDWTRVLGGALAAVSSAVLLSTLGVIGTIIGAALGSVVVSVATSLYARGLSRSREGMAQAQEAALRRVGIAQAEVRRARRRSGVGVSEAHLDQADENLAEARDQLTTDAERVTLLDRLRQLPWRRVAAVTAITFVIAIAAITAFELVAGRPVASYTGGTSSDHGTSLGNVDGGHSNPAPSPATPSGQTSPSSAPGGATPTPSSGSSSTPPTVSPSSSPTESPSGEPSASATTPTPGG
jgi:hypothetical protein